MANVSIRQRILNKEVCVGLFYKLYSESLAEMIGYSGFDFIVIDAEHSNFSPADVERVIRAADVAGLGTVVRTQDTSEASILHALDSGASGVQVPGISSLEVANEVGQAAKYYPAGTRGLTSVQRAAHFNFWNEDTDYMEKSNDDSMVVVHVENITMANQIEELCKIPNIDVLFVGPSDLSQSMGKPDQLDDPEVADVIANVFQKIKESGKVIGMYAGSPETLKKYVEMGATYITYGSDVTVISKGLKEAQQAIKDTLESIK